MTPAKVVLAVVFATLPAAPTHAYPDKPVRFPGRDTEVGKDGEAIGRAS